MLRHFGQAKLRLIFWIALATSLLAPVCAEGVEISSTPLGILISGRIDKGDYARLASYLMAPAHPERLELFLINIQLDSPGGDVSEAMKIAALFDKGFVQTSVKRGGVCASACFLLWAGGVARYNRGVLGVHRLSLVSSSSDVRHTERALAPASQAVEGFLARMGIPKRVIEKMGETSPSDLFSLDTAWLIENDLYMSMAYRPAFLDVAEKRCGMSPTAIGMRTGRVQTRKEEDEWGMCAENVRSENQSTYRPEILRLLVDARGSR